MAVSDWLTNATQALMNAGIATARLDCLVLLEDATGRDRAWLISHPEHELQRSEIESLSTKIAQRALHIPLAYLRGHAEFYGREFTVTPHTLVPRPETEAMIDTLKTLDLARGAQVQDVGTGSGCIAITAALELPGMIVSGCDVNPECIKTARQNAAALGASVRFFESDLLTPRQVRPAEAVPQTPDVLLANLPYVPDNFAINTEATHEPAAAIYGGPDGLDLYRRMLAQVAAGLHKPQYILTESLPPQHELLAAIAGTANYRLQKTNDFIQQFTLASPPVS